MQCHKCLADEPTLTPSVFSGQGICYRCQQDERAMPEYTAERQKVEHFVDMTISNMVEINRRLNKLATYCVSITHFKPYRESVVTHKGLTYAEARKVDAVHRKRIATAYPGPCFTCPTSSIERERFSEEQIMSVIDTVDAIPDAYRRDKLFNGVDIRGLAELYALFRTMNPWKEKGEDKKTA